MALGHCPLFKVLQPTQLELIVAVMDKVEVAKDQIIATRGQRNHSFYVVHKVRLLFLQGTSKNVHGAASRFVGVPSHPPARAG